MRMNVMKLVDYVQKIVHLYMNVMKLVDCVQKVVEQHIKGGNVVAEYTIANNK